MCRHRTHWNTYHFQNSICKMIFWFHLVFYLLQSQWEKELDKKVEDFDATEDYWEASEESHRASNKANSSNHGQLWQKFLFSLNQNVRKILLECKKSTTFASFSTLSNVALSKKMCTTWRSKGIFAAENSLKR